MSKDNKNLENKKVNKEELKNANGGMIPGFDGVVNKKDMRPTKDPNAPKEKDTTICTD